MNFIKKWLLRVLVLIVFIVVLLLATDNSETVALTFLGMKSVSWPISWWMVCAFIVGLLLGLALNLVSNTILRLAARKTNPPAQ